jgi:hypothetical protein
VFPYTAEEAEWLSAQAGFHYWLLGQSDLATAAPAIPANDDTPPQDRRSAN